MATSATQALTMNMRASSGSGPAPSFHRGSRKLLSFLTLAAAFVPASAASGQSGGQWAGPFDWAGQLNPLRCDSVAFDEISHAALIPVGRYQGCVMMWREGIDPTACISTRATDMWILFPDRPEQLFRVGESVDYDIF